MTTPRFTLITLPVNGREQPLRVVLVDTPDGVFGCTSEHHCSCGATAERTPTGQIRPGCEHMTAAYRWLAEQRAENAHRTRQEASGAVPAPAQVSEDLTPILGLLRTAGEHLKWPKLRLSTAVRETVAIPPGTRRSPRVWC